MNRRLLIVTVLLAAVAGIFAAIADEPPAKEAPAKETPAKESPSDDGPAKEPTPQELAEQAGAALGKHRQLSYQLPGRPPFQTAEGIKAMEVTKEQSQTIVHIGTIFNGKVLDQRKAAWDHENKALDLKGEAKEKFLKEHYAAEAKRIEQRRKWAREARQLVEKLLTEKQIKILRELEFKERTQYLAYQPQVFSQLKLEKEQQEQIQKLQEAVAKRQQELALEMQKLQIDTSAKMVELLKPEQREELRQKLEKFFEEALQVN